jgi:hypothetical protein
LRAPPGATFWIFVVSIAFAIPPAPPCAASTSPARSAPQAGEYAVSMTEQRFIDHQGEYDLPVVVAHRLDAGARRAAREAADGDYLVAGIAIPD